MAAWMMVEGEQDLLCGERRSYILVAPFSNETHLLIQQPSKAASIKGREGLDSRNIELSYGPRQFSEHILSFRSNTSETLR